jgi:hypothetical protein
MHALVEVMNALGSLQSHSRDSSTGMAACSPVER